MSADFRLAVLQVVGAVAIVLAVLGYSFWSQHERRVDVEGLDAADRKVIFDHAMRSYQRLCVEQQDKAFQEYCGRQSEFLHLFPECDPPCGDVLSKSLPTPTR